MTTPDVHDRPLPNLRLKSERELRSWSQANLAEKVGCDTKTVGRWESGDSIPRPYHRQKLCEIFGMNAEELGLIREDIRPLSLHTEEMPPGDSQNGPIDSNLTTGPASPEGASWKPRSSAFGQPQPSQQNVSRSLRKRKVALVTLTVLAILIIFAGTGVYLRASRHIKPGGEWISPLNGQTVGRVVHFSAYAYPTHSSEPLIDHVNFTVLWPGVDPRKWKIACTAVPPAANDAFSCNTDLSLLGAIAGPLRISFDVYDKAGNVNLAPNGEHTITYAP